VHGSPVRIRGQDLIQHPRNFDGGADVSYHKIAGKMKFSSFSTPTNLFFLFSFYLVYCPLTPKGYVDQTTKETGLGPCLRPQQKKFISLIVALCAKLGV
jgi:hypothetical protein